MTQRIRSARPVVFLIAFALVLGVGSAFAQTGKVVRISGTIASISSGAITLTTADGSAKTAALSAATVFLASRDAALADIRAGDAMGVTAHRDAQGRLTATVINIFPPELWSDPNMPRGQFPMDQPGQIMTNAVVTSLVSATDGHTLTMREKDLTTEIIVPDGTTINRLVMMKPVDLKTGMHVLIRGTQNTDGSIAAGAVTIVAGQG